MNLYDIGDTTLDDGKGYSLRKGGGWDGNLPPDFTVEFDGMILRLANSKWNKKMQWLEAPRGKRGELGRVKMQSTGIVYYEDFNQKLHRTDGPAVIKPNGERHWMRYGKRHRDDGPAIIRADGSEEYWIDNKRHRDDGPAVIRADGSEEYWIDGKRVEREDLL